MSSVKIPIRGGSIGLESNQTIVPKSREELTLEVDMELNIIPKIEKEGIRILPVCEKPPIIMYLHHAIPLSIILLHDIRYLYKHFIQLYWSKKWPNSWPSIFDFYIPNIINKNAFNNQIINNNTIKIDKVTIVEQTIHWINEGYYPQFTSDESLLPGTEQFGKSRPIYHQAFYYGYDKNKKIFKMLNFDTNKNFKSIDIHFDDFINSIFFDRKLERNNLRSTVFLNVVLWKVNETFLNYNYTDQEVIKSISLEIAEYLNCKKSNFDERLILPQDLLWGKDIVYYNLIALLKNEYPSAYGLQGIVGFYEHKKVMLERLLYLNKNDLIGIDIITNYTTVCKNAELAKNIYLKYLITKNDKQLLKLQSIVSEIKNNEEYILSDVCDSLEI